MSDSPSGGAEPTLEQRLGLVLRGVQRMADGLGSVEQRLPELASAERLKALSDRVDEYRVRSRTELNQVTEVVSALAQAVDVVLREQQGLTEAIRAIPAPEPPAPQEPAIDPAAIERLTEAVRGLRDDLAESHRVLSEETKAAVERVAGEQAERTLGLNKALADSGDRTIAAVRALEGPSEDLVALSAELQDLRTTLDGRHVVVTEAVAAMRAELAEVVASLREVAEPQELPPPPPPHDDTAVREALAELRDDLRRLQGEVVATAGQLRTDVGARQAELRDEVLAAIHDRGGDAPAPAPAPVEPDALPGIYDRLGGIEWRMGERLDPLFERLAALEATVASLRAQPEDTGDRAVVERLVALEAGLEQVAQREDVRRGVDRVLGAVATSEQAVAGEVRAVDARVGAIAEEIRVVRVLRDGLEALAQGVDGVRQLAARAATSQQMGEVTHELSSVLAEIEMARSTVLRVEQSTTPVAAEVVAVGSDIDGLAQRIDHLAEVVEQRSSSHATAEVAQKLRQVGESAKVLGNGVLEDLRVRRSRKR